MLLRRCRFTVLEHGRRLIDSSSSFWLVVDHSTYDVNLDRTIPSKTPVPVLIFVLVLIFVERAASESTQHTETTINDQVHPMQKSIFKILVRIQNTSVQVPVDY